MDFKRTESYTELAYGAETRPITAEPLPGYSDEEVIDSLKNFGATAVMVLSPGFISAEVCGEALGKLERIAHVHFKQRSYAR